jgi:hypothetical protein
MNWYEADSRRHESNAAKHLSNGNPTYAEGSMLKAQRFRQRARQLDHLRYGPYPKTQLQQLVSDRVEAATKIIADEIVEALYG